MSSLDMGGSVIGSPTDSWSPYVQKGWVRGIPHLAKNERDVGHPGVLEGGEFWRVEGSRRWRVLEGGEF
jgi:hypothetical protein